MATYGAIHFEEASSPKITRSASSTDPSVRLRASGGEVIAAAQVPRTAKIDAYCTASELEALRLALIAGLLQTLILDDETLDNAFLSEINEPTDIFGRGTWRVSLSFEVATRVDTPHLLCWVGGDVVQGVIGITTDVGRDTRFGKATITVGERPTVSSGQPVVIQGGINDVLGSMFQGIVESVPEEFYPGEWSIVCTGRFKWAQRQLDQDLDYTGDTDAEMIDDLLQRRGITARDIPASTWTLGTKAKVVARKGDTIISWIDRHDEVTRMRTYENHEGTVMRRRDDPFETGDPALILTVGENVLSIQHTLDADAIRNDVQIKGISHNGVEVAYSASVGNATLDALLGQSGSLNTITVNTSLIETNADAETFGDRILADLAPTQHKLSLTVPLDPAIVPDLPIMVHAEPFATTGIRCLVRNVKHTIDGVGGTTQLDCNTGNYGSL